MQKKKTFIKTYQKMTCVQVNKRVTCGKNIEKSQLRYTYNNVDIQPPN